MTIRGYISFLSLEFQRSRSCPSLHFASSSFCYIEQITTAFARWRQGMQMESLQIPSQANSLFDLSQKTVETLIETHWFFRGYIGSI